MSLAIIYLNSRLFQTIFLFVEPDVFVLLGIPFCS